MIESFQNGFDAFFEKTSSVFMLMGALFLLAALSVFATHIPRR